MARRPSHDLDVTLNSVAFEGMLNSFGLNVSQATPSVETFTDQGPRVIADNYDWDEDLAGPNDFASGQQDATLFGLLGSQGVAHTVEPTGSAAGADTPTYTGTVVLNSYQLKWGVRQPATYSAKLSGNSALARNVA